MRIETSEEVYVQLVQAKSRVAPIKKISIPRLELLPATIGSRLANSMTEYFLSDLQASFIFWTDSSTVLAWLNRANNWSVFVRNRVNEILTLTKKQQWHHVPGDLNPADLPSRGCSAKKLLKSRWWERPQWLKFPSSEWPSQNFSFNEEDIKNETLKTLVCNLDFADSGWYYKYFSRFSEVVRMVAWMKRFIDNCRTQTRFGWIWNSIWLN